LNNFRDEIPFSTDRAGKSVSSAAEFAQRPGCQPQSGGRR